MFVREDSESEPGQVVAVRTLLGEPNGATMLESSPRTHVELSPDAIKTSPWPHAPLAGATQLGLAPVTVDSTCESVHDGDTAAEEIAMEYTPTFSDDASDQYRMEADTSATMPDGLPVVDSTKGVMACSVPPEPGTPEKIPFKPASAATALQ